MKKTALWIIISGLLATAAVSFADVTVDFSSVTNTGKGVGTTLTLNFSVDGTGNVTLDAQTSNPGNPANTALVDQLDGHVGTVSSGFGTSFSIVYTGIDETGGANWIVLGEDNLGDPNGLAIQGRNAYRIDWFSGAGFQSEVLTMAVDVSGIGAGNTIDFKETSLRGPSSAEGLITDFFGSAANYGAGTVALGSGFELVGGSSDSISFAQATQPAAGATGYAISTLTFDLVASAPVADVTVDFSSVTNTGAVVGTSLTLNFSVDGTGNVTLDAQSPNMGDPAVAALVNQLDGPVGTVSSGFGTSFSMQYTGIDEYGNNAGIVLGEDNLGTSNGLGVQGRNMYRIDWYSEAGFQSEVLTAEVDTTAIGSGNTLKLQQTILAGAGVGADARITDFSGSAMDYGIGTVALGSGFELTGGNTDSISFEQATQPGAGATGYAVSSLTFELVAGPVAPIQHLNATVAHTVTGSNPVTEWADLSGYSNNAVSAFGTVTYPSTSLSASGLAGMDFSSSAGSLELFSAAASDSWLDQSASNGFAVVLAFKCDEVIANWNDLIGNNSEISSGFGLRYGSAGQIVTYLGGQATTRSGNPIQAGDSVVFAFNYDAVNGEYTFWDSNNGDSVTVSVAAADFSLNNAVTLGLTTSGTRYFNGMVGEVKIFDETLSVADFATVRNAMYDKWVYVEQTLFVSSIFQNNMVLQRDMDVPVWGTALPGSNVVVKLDSVIVDTVTADAEGKWMAHMGSYPDDGGTAHTLEILSDGEDPVMFANVVFGDVYLAAGQSNMNRTMNIVWGASDEAAGANYPLIREVTIQNDTHSTVPVEEAKIKNGWRECSPATAPGFSATAYFFAKNVYLNTGVPIGLINASWGAHQIMHFIAPEGVAAIPELVGLRQQLLDGPTPTSSNGVYYNVYNSMIYPLVPYGIRGFVWYQCEWDTQDDHNRQMYHQKMRALMAGWRKVWGQGDLPFYYVQLPTWENSGIAGQTRESQLLALSETNAGMAVTIDIGAFPELEVRPGVTDNPLHPSNKQDVGSRLAQWALRDIYGQSVVPSGPLFKEAVVESSRIRVSFDYAAGLFGGTKYITNAVLAVTNALDNFEIAGTNGVFVAADAVIDGQTVLVSSPSVSDPVDVRYCYSDWPDRYNVKLYNAALLPASPFRTDIDHGLLVTSGSGDGWYDAGETVNIVADAPAGGKVFDRWVGLPSGMADPTASSTTLTMPAHQTYLMAVYRDSGESTYTLTVNQGDGDGPSKADCYRAIKAEPAPPGYRFSQWTGDTQTVENISAPYTTLSTSLGNLSLSATYELIGTLYDAWIAVYGVSGGPADDHDGDEVDNLSEYAFAGNPTNALDQGTLPVFISESGSMKYVHPQRSDDDTLVYTVQTRTNLVQGSWTNAGYSIAATNVTGNTLNFVTNDVAAVENQKFIRLMIEQ